MIFGAILLLYSKLRDLIQNPELWCDIKYRYSMTSQKSSKMAEYNTIMLSRLLTYMIFEMQKEKPHMKKQIIII